MTLNVEIEREDDGLWIAVVRELPEVLIYGASADEVRARVQALALRVLADRLERGELPPAWLTITFSAREFGCG
jgi:predicted RNase H-like HicB family nuclease